MVNLELLQKLIKSGEYPNLIGQEDVDNIQRIVDSNESLFAKPWYDKGSVRFDEGCYFEVSTTNEKSYGFRKKIPTNIEQYQAHNGTIFHNKIFKYLGYILGYKFYASNPDQPLEYLSFNGDLPLFKVTIDCIAAFAANVTGNNNTQPLKDALSYLDFSEMDVFEVPNADPHKTNQSETDPPPRPYNIEDNHSDTHEEEENFVWDYDIDTIVIDVYRKTFKVVLSKKAGENADRLRNAVSHMFDENTSIYRNVQSVLNIMDGDYFQSEDIASSIALEFTAEGLRPRFEFQVASWTSKVAPLGQPASDNQRRYDEKCASHDRSVSHIVSSGTTYKWLPDNWSEEISKWENSNIAENIHGVMTIIVDNNGIEVTDAFGYSGPKGGPQPTNS